MTTVGSYGVMQEREDMQECSCGHIMKLHRYDHFFLGHCTAEDCDCKGFTYKLPEMKGSVEYVRALRSFDD